MVQHLRPQMLTQQLANRCAVRFSVGQGIFPFQVLIGANEMQQHDIVPLPKVHSFGYSPDCHRIFRAQ